MHYKCLVCFLSHFFAGIQAQLLTGRNFSSFVESNQHYTSIRFLPQRISKARIHEKTTDKPIVGIEMLHYSRHHASIRIARLMMESVKRDKARYVFRILPNFQIPLPHVCGYYCELSKRIARTCFERETCDSNF